MTLPLALPEYEVRFKSGEIGAPTEPKRWGIGVNPEALPLAHPEPPQVEGKQ